MNSGILTPNDELTSGEAAPGACRSKATSALAAALIPLGALVAADSANAGFDGLPESWDRSSLVTSTVNENTPGVFSYDFTVFNTSTPGPETCDPFSGDCPATPLLVDWELPLFSLDDIDVNSIRTPDGWSVEIIAPTDSTVVYNNPIPFDPFAGPGDPEGAPFGFYDWNYDAGSDPLLSTTPGLYGPNPDVFNAPPLIIHWYVNDTDGYSCGELRQCGSALAPIDSPDEDLLLGNSRGGFGFDSSYGAQNAPYLSSWLFLDPISGDPPIPDQGFGTPFSPARQAAQGVVPPPNPMPAPGAFALIVAGLAGLFFQRRSPKRKA